VAFLLTTRRVKDNGMTSYQHLRGKRFVQPLLCFGEKCLWKLREKGPQRAESSKIEPRWKRGIFRGFVRKTNEYEVWDIEDNDIATSRCVKRLVRGKRFDAETLTKVAKTPHDKHVATEAPPVFQDLPPQEPTEARPGRAARSFDIYRKDVEKWGFSSEGCPKCARAMRYGWDTAKQYTHSASCRLRFRKIFLESDTEKHRVEDSERRQNRWLAACQGRR
jgi:hypothetical protein